VNFTVRSNDKIELVVYKIYNYFFYKTMSPFKETLSLGNDENEQKFNGRYQNILYHLREYGFEPTPAEASCLRQLARECIDEDIKDDKFIEESGRENMDGILVSTEIIKRFFWHYYGVNLNEYFMGAKKEDLAKTRRDLYKYVQEKLRPEKELI